MEKRFVSIWFPYLLADYYIRKHPSLVNIPFVLSAPSHGRMIIKAISLKAKRIGIRDAMVVADAKAIYPELKIVTIQEDKSNELLKNLAEWCIRFSPVVAVDAPDGLLIDVTGCTHLWGGEQKYLDNIIERISALGYHVRAAMAGTMGAAWALARFGKPSTICKSDEEKEALLRLPSEALNPEPQVLDTLTKLGLHHIGSFINMPAQTLRRRFGNAFLQRLHQALGMEEEFMQPIQITTQYYQHLPCLEPVSTAKAIEIALEQLLQAMCARLQKEELGIRHCIFSTYRTDGKKQQLTISTGRASVHVTHLLKLFEHKLPSIAPGPGIELFTLDAPQVMPLVTVQNAIWEKDAALDDIKLAELLDRIADRIGEKNIQHFQPAEHYWPERAYKLSNRENETNIEKWPVGFPRPLQLLQNPIHIKVMVLLPDYPPISFNYNNNIHKVVKADGPERIEQEWWLQQGHYRDYYCVEDESGCRYWIFRLGHYENHKPEWFLHGFFA